MGSARVDAFVVDRHHERREPGPEIVVEQLALPGVAVGARHPGAVAVDEMRGGWVVSMVK